jgi:hypothetical protein
MGMIVQSSATNQVVIYTHELLSWVLLTLRLVCLLDCRRERTVHGRSRARTNLRTAPATASMGPPARQTLDQAQIHRGTRGGGREV